MGANRYHGSFGLWGTAERVPFPRVSPCYRAGVTPAEDRGSFAGDRKIFFAVGELASHPFV